LKRFWVHKALTTSDETYVLGAPTRMQSKNIFWRDIKAMIPTEVVEKISESELSITLKNGTILIVAGLESHERLQGTVIHGFGCTEFQLINLSVYTETIEPSLNDTNGIAILEGRPHGRNHFYDFYQRGKSDDYPEWMSYSWTSETVLSPKQIDRAKKNLSLADYNREYLAKFDSFSSTPYYGFTDKNLGVREINPDEPVLIVCDFNATEKPMSWGIGQWFYDEINHNKCLYIDEELVYQYTNTLTMCDILKSNLKQRWGENKFNNLRLHWHGDFAGNHKTSNSSYSDWEIIREEFRNIKEYEEYVQPCKSIRDSIASTNAFFMNAKNEVRLIVNKDKCRTLVDDWRKAEWKPNGRELSESDPLRGHICRAVDYCIYYHFPIIGTTRTEVSDNKPKRQSGRLYVLGGRQ